MTQPQPPQELRIGNGRLIDLLGALIPQAGNLGNLGTYFALGGEVFSILRDWSDIDESFDTTEGLQSRLRLVVRLGKLYTARTPGTEDDALVVTLDSAVENVSVMNVIASIFRAFKAQAGDNATPTVGAFQMYVASDAVKSQIGEVAFEQQIDITTIMEIIQLVMKIIAMFKTTPATPNAPAGSTVLEF